MHATSFSKIIGLTDILIYRSQDFVNLTIHAIHNNIHTCMYCDCVIIVIVIYFYPYILVCMYCNYVIIVMYLFISILTYLYVL